MPKITFVTPAGQSVTVDSSAENLMEAALEHDIPGIGGDCGGVCSCSTCHVRIDPAWVDRVGPAEAHEQDALSFADGVTPHSRLSCQIPLTAALEGLVVNVGAEA